MTRRWLALPLLGLLLSGQACLRLTSPRASGPSILRSDDDGQTWQAKDFIERTVVRKRERLVTLGGVAARSLSFSRANPQLAGLATDKGFYLTTNRGEQWQRTGYRGPVQAAAFDPVDEQTVALASPSSILRTVDRGQTWQPVFVVTRPDEQLTGLIVDFHNPRRLIASASTGTLYSSEDAGQTWSVLGRLTDRLTGFVVHPTDSRILFLTSQDQVLWKSVDGGRSWSGLKAGLAPYPQANQSPRLIFADAAGATLLLASQFGLLRSTDGGNSWQPVSTLLTPPVTIEGVAADPTNPNRITLFVGQTLHRTTDGGTSWKVASLPTSRPLTFVVLDPQDPQVLYLGANPPPKRR